MNCRFFLLTLREHLRQPMYVLTSLLFPAMFFWFFGVPNAKDQGSSVLLMGSFASFAVLGVVLFQLAVQVSQERTGPWFRYVLTLPVSPFKMAISRVAASFVLALFAAVIVIAVSFLATPLDGKEINWASFVLTLLIGGIPFALLGLILGYTVKGKAALPTANMVYLPLSFAGGLWLPPNALPKVIQDISEYLPTRMYGELVWASLFQKETPAFSVKGLVLYNILFLLVFLVLQFRPLRKGV